MTIASTMLASKLAVAVLGLFVFPAKAGISIKLNVAKHICMFYD